MRNNIILPLKLLLLAAMLLTSCSKNKNKSKNKFFKVAVKHSVLSVNPFSYNNTSEYLIGLKIFEELISWNYNTQVYDLTLLDKLKIAEDYSSAELSLKKDVFFHNGEQFTTKDVLYFIECGKDQKCFSPMLFSTFKEFKKIKIISDFKMKIIFAESKLSNLHFLTSIRAVSSKYYTGKKSGEGMLEPVGTGPYKFLNFDKTRQKVSLIKNKNWWGSRIPSNKDSHNFNIIEYKSIKDKQLALDMLAQSKIDFVSGISFSFYKNNKNRESFQIQKIDKKNKNNFMGIRWNFKNKIFKNREVREALSLLIDKNFLNDKLHSGSKIIVSRPAFSTTPWNKENESLGYQFDPKKAMSLLNKNGWADSNKDGVLDKNGQDLEFTIMIPREEYHIVLSVMKETYKKYGIVMNVSLLDLARYYEASKQRKFDATFSSMLLSKFVPHYIFQSNAIGNYQNYNSKEMDKLLVQTQEVKNRNIERKLYSSIEGIIEEDFVITFLFLDRNFIFAASNNIDIKEPDGFYFVDYSKWKFR